MATPAQFEANRENARASTGPRTSKGKTASSRNAVVTGLFTAAAFVIDGEESLFEEFAARFIAELRPVGLVEETFVAEITGASWRLRRCSLVDSDPHAPFSVLAAVERARSHAHNILRRSFAELRRLQTERQTRREIGTETDDAIPGAADTRQVKVAANHTRRAILLDHKVRQLSRPDDKLASFCKNTPPNANPGFAASPTMNPLSRRLPDRPPATETARNRIPHAIDARSGEGQGRDSLA